MKKEPRAGLAEDGNQARMTTPVPTLTDQALLTENAELRARLEESVEMLRAIRAGEVNPHVVEGDDASDSCGAERRQGEAALTAEFFSQIIEQAPSGVYVVDAQFRVAQMNAQTLPYFAAAQPLIGRDFTEVLEIVWGPEIGHQIESIFRHTLTTGERYVSPRFSELRHDIGVEQAFAWETQRITLPDGQHGVVCYFQEVTARDRAEAALRASEARFRAAVGAVSSLIWTNNARGEMEAEQPGWGSFTGQSRKEYHGYGWAKAVHPEDAQPTLDAWNQAVADRRIFEFEHRVRRSDGEWRLCSVRAVPVLDEAGEIREWVGVHTDITERKQAEEALRESEEQFKTMANTAPAMIWVTNPDATLKFISRGWHEYTGQSEIEAFGKEGFGWLDAVHPEDAERAGQVFLDANARQEPFSLDYRIRRADGEYCWAIDSGRPRFDDAEHFLGYVGSVTDVHERNQAEGALRESEARLGGILRRSPAGIVQTDATGCMTLVNPRWSEMMGYPEAELLSRNILDITHPSSVDETAAAFGRLAAGGPDFQIEKAYRRKDGSILRAQSNVAAIRSPDGEFLGIIAAVLDISERIRTEEELRRLAAELSDANRRKNEFLATLAHELRNPLAPVRTAVAILRMKGPAIAELQWARDVIDRQVDTMSRLVDDLMDVSRIDQGKIELRREQVELRKVVQSAVETSCPLIEEMGHELTVTLPTDPVMVDVDLTRMAQVFMNILTNAAKYTERGGRIDLRAEVQGSDVAVSVVDTGIGIAAQKLTTIFEMFSQVEGALSRSQGGLGIGLSLAKQLVEMHGGGVEAKSAGPGMGSEFLVRLPIVVDAQTCRGEVSEDHGDSDQPTSGLRILMVDDNLDIARVMTVILEMWGYRVHTAHDGEEAVTAAREFQPHVVLCDIGLPKLNGYEACRLMKAQAWHPKMVLIAISGWGQDEDRRKSEEAGFDHHLVKPIDMQSLMKLFSSLDT